MDRKVVSLSLLLALVLGCAGAFWWLGDDTAPTPFAGDDPARDAPPAPSLTATDEANAADASFAPATIGDVRAAAASTGGSGLPYPTDAEWVPVLVVDRTTREPVVGADVGWVGETIEKLFESDEYDPDRVFLWRSAELQVERAGWRTTTDEHGVARVTFRKWTNVIAAHDGRFGQLRLHEETLTPPGGWVLELEPDHTLRVQVVDDAGVPAPGVLVAIGIYEDGRLNHFWGWNAVARTETPDGTAVIRHLQVLAKDDEAGADGRPGRWRVRTHLPGFDDPGIAITLADLPEDPLVLRLPPCGTVRARAELGGAPLPGFTGALLREKVEDKRDYWQQRTSDFRTADPDGWARFPHVPLGREFFASTRTNGSLSTAFAGPTARGQEITVVIAPTAETMLLAGRVVDADRQPVRDRMFQCQARGPKLRAHTGFRTDAEGRFTVSLGQAGEDNRVDLLRIDTYRAGEAPQRVELPPRTLRPGVEQLGDITLGGGALIVGGTFVDENGPCTEPVSFWVQYLDESVADEKRRWRGMRDALIHQDGSGRFEVRGTAPSGRLRLQFSTYERLPTEPIEFRAGTEDLEIRLRRGRTLAATVLHTEGTPPDGFFAQLVPADPTAGADDADADRYRVEPWSEDGRRSNLIWPALPDGVYTMELRLWAAAEPVLRIPDVRVPGPDGGDPRLVDIDLGQFARVVTLRLFDAEGKPLESVEGLAFPVGQDPAAAWTATQLYAQTIKTLLPIGGSSELLVGVSGYEPCRVALTGATVDVRLHAWPTIDLTVDGVPELPEGAKLRVRLEPEAVDRSRYRSQWSHGNRNEVFAVPQSSVAVVDGRAAVPIGDGPHRIEVSLSVERRHADLPVTRPARVLPTSGSVRVEIAAEAWQTALEQIRQEPK